MNLFECCAPSKPSATTKPLFSFSNHAITVLATDTSHHFGLSAFGLSTAEVVILRLPSTCESSAPTTVRQPVRSAVGNQQPPSIKEKEPHSATDDWDHQVPTLLAAQSENEYERRVVMYTKLQSPPSLLLWAPFQRGIALVCLVPTRGIIIFRWRSGAWREDSFEQGSELVKCLSVCFNATTCDLICACPGKIVLLRRHWDGLWKPVLQDSQKQIIFKEKAMEKDILVVTCGTLYIITLDVDGIARIVDCRNSEELDKITMMATHKPKHAAVAPSSGRSFELLAMAATSMLWVFAISSATSGRKGCTIMEASVPLSKQNQQGSSKRCSSSSGCAVENIIKISWSAVGDQVFVALDDAVIRCFRISLSKSFASPATGLRTVEDAVQFCATSALCVKITEVASVIHPFHFSGPLQLLSQGAIQKVI